MPVLAICDGCRAEYHLKDEYSGKKVKCKDCGAVIMVPMAEEPEAWLPPDGEENGPFDHDRFLINQKRISISEKYYVCDDKQNPILFVERPAHVLKGLLAFGAGVVTAIFGLILSCIPLAAANNPQLSGIAWVGCLIGVFLTLLATCAVIILIMPKRHISIYTDDTKAHLLLEVFQDEKLNILKANYTVRDPQEGTLGKLRKNYLYNLFRKRWDVFHPDGAPMVVAREDSLILSLLRRFLGPLFGLLRTNFVIFRPNTEVIIGEFNRKATLFDRYILDMSADRTHELDRRLAVALGILLDTGERR